MDTHIYVKIAVLFYSLSLAATYPPANGYTAFRFFLTTALVFNGFAAALRYYQAWPMLPMYLGPVALSFLMGVLVLITVRRDSDGTFVGRTLLALTFAIAAAAMLFPKDFYLPFIKSRTPAAHLFFLFGIAGRGCFLVAAAWALAGFLRKEDRKLKRNEDEMSGNFKDTGNQGGTESEKAGAGDAERDGIYAKKGLNLNIIEDRIAHCPPSAFAPTHHTDAPIPHRPLSRPPLLHTTRWIVWGFAFLTLSMFCGELWSYMGWGTPVVWDDPAITTTMATWFFYICWLHLHLTGAWNARGRSIFAACGAPAVFSFNLLPELGPFRWPF